ncbi:MAG: hypothetical protein ACLGH0_15415, partial [Thermoanaerobaculia bacterium]
RIAEDALLVEREWVDVSPFAGWKLIDAEEPFAGNALLVNDTIIYPRAFPRTRAKLPGKVVLVDADELAKAEGGVTCCALLLSEP